jgi:hypothetical protein
MGSQHTDEGDDAPANEIQCVRPSILLTLTITDLYVFSSGRTLPREIHIRSRLQQVAGT